MSIEPFNVQLPVQYRGLEDMATAENYDFAVGLVSRMDVNTRAIISAVRDQCVTDQALVASGTGSVAVSSDVDGAEMEAVIWQG